MSKSERIELPRVMLIAGEASGDLHGSNLVRSVHDMAPEVEFFGVGGEKLRAAGMDLLFGLEDMSLMGISEIIPKLGHAWQVLRTLRAEIEKQQPAALVLIDYPDFNLMLAKTAKKAGVPVFYFICPQIWATRTGRVKKMAAFVDRRVVVFPFEQDFYASHGLTADFVGHPLLDILAEPRPKPEMKSELGFDPDRLLLLLLPGSRESVVKALLPIMLASAGRIAERHPGLVIALGRAETLAMDFLDSFLAKAPVKVQVITGQTHALQNAADVAVAASGTATLETALMLTPMVVVYRTQFLTYHIAVRMIKTRHVAMANLIAGREVVPELLQDEARPERIAAEVQRILGEQEWREGMLAGLRSVRAGLGKPGACRRAAELLLRDMTNHRA